MHPLDALGSPVRRDILLSLRDKPLAVNEIAAHFPISRPAISRHLRTLEQAGLVESREEGVKSVYAIKMVGFASVRDFIDQFWDSALARLSKLAEREGYSRPKK